MPDKLGDSIVQFSLSTVFLVILSFAMVCAVVSPLFVDGSTVPPPLLALVVLAPFIWTITGVNLGAELLPNHYGADIGFWLVFGPIVIFVIYIMLTPAVG